MTAEPAFSGTTPVAHWYRRLLELQRPQRGLSDDERAARCDAIFQATTTLMHQPAETLADVDLKLAVLCARLRSEDYAPTSPNGALTALLGESAREDIGRLAIGH